MSDELMINTKIILPSRYTQCRYIDWDVKDSEERQCEHRWDRINECGPVDGRKICKKSIHA
jgi:hypothetical protein